MNRLSPTPIGWRLLRLAGDLGVGLAAFYGAFLLRIRLPIPFTQFLLPTDRLRFFASEWWILGVSQILTLYFFGFYDPPRGRFGLDQVRRLLAALSIQALALAGFYFVTDRTFPRSVLLLFVPLNLLLLWMLRSLLERAHRPPRRRVVLVGDATAARELAAKLRAQGSSAIEIVGFVASPDGSQGDGDELGAPLGTWDELPDLLASGRADDLILVPHPLDWQTRLLDRLAARQATSANVLLLPGPLESLIGRMRYRFLDDLPLIEVVRDRANGG